MDSENATPSETYAVKPESWLVRLWQAGDDWEQHPVRTLTLAVIAIAGLVALAWFGRDYM
jgi:hypothetical protein